jgi:signal transduction histidine kinase
VSDENSSIGGELQPDSPLKFSALEILASRYGLLTDIARALIRESDPERYAEEALERLGGLISFVRCSLALHEPGSQTYRMRVRIERRPGVARGEFHDVPLTSGVGGRTISGGRVVYVPNFDQVDPRLGVVDPEMESGHLRSVLSIPLKTGSTVLGALILGTERPEAYTSMDLRNARQVTDMLALALERHQALERRMELDAALRAESRRLANAVSRLEATNLELDSFIYAASHDLRAPLLSIGGLAELAELALQSGDITDLGDMLARIRKNVRRLDQVVSDTLQVSRAHRMERCDVDTDVEELIEEVVESLAGMIQEGQMGVLIRNEVEGPVRLERRRLRQILVNLLSNAIKYRDPKADASYIRVESHVEHSWLVVVVADNGIGIPEDQRGRVFDMFYRASNQSTGAGLGLYLVKEHATAMEADVSLRCEGETEFTVRIPLPLAGEEQ